ncbi:DUF2461 domain-containing protein [Neolewinella lacunae]|uniref:DUF2461 domain-containing protein n=1 Tax=Neolewinella lacunae TaxID=1517758 RepID=A0A923PK89_9BACT|nr:DUF2461 domain-containing protein [Neolewinella lacunae]MBC6995595.1 DUF2461 domain-containing protein [Neolewinella lacunae]MDN3635631.1 DUF2461 domain-containing protein [Neolewinella lacunae]
MAQIKPATLTFLRELAANNNREWFQDHKKAYDAARANVAEFAQALLDRLAQSDVLETADGKKSMFRIYRDVRFSKNKDPYKTTLSGYFVRDGKLRRGGYYYQFSPAESIVGGGFYDMESHDLKRVREELAVDGGPLRAIMANKDFVRIFGEMRGEKLKTAPQGYDKAHPNIDLLRFKQFYAMREFTEKEVLSAGLLDLSHEALLALRPFFDYFTEVLTTDANGELIV